MSSRLLALWTLATAALGAGVTAPAFADEQIQAAPPDRYTPPNPTMDQGERLTFMNADLSTHDVTATQDGSDGKPRCEGAAASRSPCEERRATPPATWPW